jgi:hypothetical protein
MTDAWAQQVEAWHDFYVIVGGAAAGLTGLMFIVVSLGGTVRRAAPGVRAFVTPTVVFFSSIVVVAAVMAMPTLPAATVATVLAVGGVGGLAYMIVIRGHQMWRNSSLDWLDWWWYISLPFLTYLLTIVAAAVIWLRGAFGLLLLGGTTLLLLVIAIHNAWDLVLWMTQQRGGGADQSGGSGESGGAGQVP